MQATLEVAGADAAPPTSQSSTNVTDTPSHPPIGVSDWVMFQVDFNAEPTPAFVVHVGYDGSCELQYFQRTGESTGTFMGRENVKYIDDPAAKSEHYIVNVINDDEGGLWQYTPGTRLLYECLANQKKLGERIDDLLAAVAKSGWQPATRESQAAKSPKAAADKL